VPPAPHILLVEDNLDDVRLVMRFIEKHIGEVSLVVAHSAVEALSRLDDHLLAAPAVIILDLGLPIVGGTQLLRMIKSKPDCHAIPIIVLTGSRDKAELDAVIDFGAAAYFVKPDRWDSYLEFARAVRRLLDSGSETVRMAVNTAGMPVDTAISAEVETALHGLSTEDRQMIRLGLKQGYLTSRHVEHALQEQRILADRGIERSVWFLVVELGLIDHERVRRLQELERASAVRALEFEGYILNGKIGKGGMGTVYRARNRAGAEAAIKLLSPRSSSFPALSERFLIEAQAGARLNHPNITRVLGSGTYDGQLYLIMELVHGKNLQSHITASGPLPESEAIQLVVQMAKALSYAWSHGVIHRDVKPANILLSTPRLDRNEPFCSKLCDFGLAKTWSIDGEPATPGLTQTGVVLGTPHYMSPEQIQGIKGLDSRVDVYSLGASLFYALSGSTLFQDESSTAIMRMHLSVTADMTRLIAQGVSAALVAVIEQMLEKDRDRRPDWDQVIERLRSFAPEVVGANDSDTGTRNYAVRPVIKTGLT